jgi:hypothetical protein
MTFDCCFLIFNINHAAPAAVLEQAKEGTASQQARGEEGRG